MGVSGSGGPAFRAPQLKKEAFVDTILVRCPRCAEVAHVIPVPGVSESDAPSMYVRRSLVCRSCGLSRTHPGRGLVFGFGAEPITDPSFDVPLWLQTETRHGPLWAYDLEHLQLIGQFVQASLRERAPWYETGGKMTFLARLPAWIKQAENRAEVLRAIDRMRGSPAN
ncbi:hypothetical protein [Streptomyces noursei]|uniref:hypothetical protein n=1 Tax=Streptomyces noursei TaxID=1971 RepID=UPI00199ADF8C|nr:hypothetical protein [Streptomyces noursei]MCZ1020936.1 hypothetical protein [Streptomyces noursei]GGX35134.1 hypothetical protein GCM10010341_65800 [Streptomyces noursei]